MHWGYLAAAYLSLFLLGLIDNARGPLFPQILDDFQVNSTVGSLFFSVASGAGLIANLLSRYWLPLWGPMKGLRVFLIFQAVGTYGMGWAGDLLSFPFLILSSFVFGCSLGGLGICMNILVVQGSTEKSRRRWLSGFHTMYGIASLLAPIVIVLWSQRGGSWSSCLQLFSVLPILLFFFTFQWDPSKKKKSEKNLAWLPFSQRFWISTMISACVATEILLSSRLVYYLERGENWPATDASLYLSLFFIFLTLGRFLLAIVPWPISNATWLLVSVISSIGLLVLGLSAHPLFLCLSGLTLSIYVPCGLDWISEKFPQSSDLLIASVMTGMGLALVLSHNLVGWLTDLYNIQIAFHLSILYLLITLALTLLLTRPEPQKSGVI